MKTIKFLKPWTIISPYDLEDNETSRIYSKNSSRCKSVNIQRHPRSPIPIKIRKSLPKRIENNSHVLTPTRSSLLKSVENPKKLAKSKSESNLSKQQRKDHDDEERILDELNKRVSEMQDEFQNISLRKSFPFLLEIDIDKIENEYSSPVQFRDSHPSIVSQYISNHIGESSPFDVLSGKIYSSSKNIKFSECTKAENRKRKKKRLESFQNVEIVYEEESKTDLTIFWKVIAGRLIEISLKLQKEIILKLKNFAKKSRKVKNPVFRRIRSLADVSEKIEEMIHLSLKKNDNYLQDLLEKPAEVKSLSVVYNPNYLQSQEFLVDMVLGLWGKYLKPLTYSKMSVFVKIEQLIAEIQAKKEFDTDSLLLELIPLLLTTDRLEEAERFLDQFSSELLASNKTLIWRAFLAVVRGKNTSNEFYLMSGLIPPANFSIHFKIMQVYSFFHSCVFLKTSRSVSFAKTLQLGEWEDLIIADLYSKCQDKTSEEQSLKLFETLFETSLNLSLKFLAFCRIFQIFKSYNQNSRAFELIKSAERANFPGEFKIIVDSYLIKTFAKMNTKIQIQSDIPLLKYQFCRLTLKYNLQSSLNEVLKYLKEICEYCQVFNLGTCQFSVNFWKFLLFHKLKVQKLAKIQAEKTLKFTSKDHLKVSAIQEILMSFDYLEKLLEQLSVLAIQKDIPGLLRVSASLEKLDDFLGTCVKTIAKQAVFNKEKIPMHKFEGFFALWTVSYRRSKNKEKQFKSLEGQEAIDRRDNKHPLYIVDVKLIRKLKKTGEKSFG